MRDGTGFQRLFAALIIGAFVAASPATATYPYATYGASVMSGAATSTTAAAREASAAATVRDAMLGTAAAFKEANDAGGVHGRMFEHRHIERPATVGDQSAVYAHLAPLLTTTHADVLAVGSAQIAESHGVQYAAAAAGAAMVGGVTMATEAFNTSSARHVLQTRLPFDVDALMIARYAVQSRLRCRRTSILYVAIPQAAAVATRLREALVSMEYDDTPEPVAIQFSNVTDFLIKATLAIRPSSSSRSSRCIAVIHDTAGFVDTLTALNIIMNVTDYTFLTTSVTHATDWRQLPGAADQWYRNVYSVAHLPDPSDTRFALSTRFAAAVAALRAIGYPVYTTARLLGGSADDAERDWVATHAALEAYVNARLFIDAVRATSAAGVTRTAVIDSVYRQRFFVVDDFPIGYYNDVCSGRDRELGVVPCGCNSGGRRMFMTRVNRATGTARQLFDDRTNFDVGLSEFTLGAATCGVNNTFATVKLTTPAIHVMVKDSTIPAPQRRISEVMQQRMYDVVQLVRGDDASGVDLDIVLANPPTNVALNSEAFVTAIPSLVRAQAYAAVAAGDRTTLKDVTGVLMFAPVEYRAAVKPDPLVPFEQWNAFYVPMFPTLQDFAVTALEHAVAGPRGAGRVHVIGDTAAEVAMLRKVAHHHQRDPATEAVLFGSTAEATAEVAAGSAEAVRIDGALAAAFGAAADGDTVVVAVQNERALASIIARHAGEHAGVQVVLATSEFVLFSTVVNISLAEGVTSAPANVLYGTGLAHQGTSAFFADPAEYYTAAIASLSFAAADDLARTSATDNSAEAYAASVYASRTVGPGFADVLAGPFVNRSCRLTETVEDHPETECQCNRALNTFYLRSLRAFFVTAYNVYSAGANATAAAASAAQPAVFAYSNVGCGYEFEALRIASEDFLIRDVAIGAAAGLVFCIILLIVAVKLARRGQRDNSCAPKDASKPFAMVFTDIQASTTLWARAPAHMGPAVDQHHALIRELIPKHRGYEVKTIGDSFMVAFQEAKDAVEFALGLQTVLYEADWGTGVFDETYKELIAEAEAIRLAELPQQNAPSNAHVPGMILQPAARSPGVPPERRTKGFSYFDGADPDEPKPYDHSVWQGLRVRVGVHYGLGDIKLDPVSQGYDYYGTVVNTAARVEGVAHGGQVVVTAAVYDALTKDGTESFDVADAAVDEFGPCPLRGLDEPVRLYQVLPSRFKARTYPPLRLDIENDPNAAEDDSDAGRESTVASDVASQHSAASSVAGGTYTYDDLVAWLARRERDPKLRDNLARRVRMGKIMLETLLSTSTPKYKEQAIQHLVEQWRIGELKKDPKLRKFKRHMDAAELNITLLAMRVSNAAESRRAEDPSADGAAEGLGETRSLRVSDVSPQPLSPV